MSSDRIERKRRSEFDTSDNSADEQPAVKVRRLDSALSLGTIVSEACKSFFSWITPEFVKKMAVRVSPRANNAGKVDGNYFKPIELSAEEQDEECIVVSVQNGTGARSKSKRNSPSKSIKSSSSSKLPLSHIPNYKETVKYLEEHKKVNGYPVRSETKKEEANRSRRSEKWINAPITNPRSQIDIILNKDNEVEIIDEVYPAMRSPNQERRMSLFSDNGVSRRERTSLFGDIRNISRPSYNTRSYTAVEVVRLQEKVQYGLLLERVAKQSPIYQPAFPNEVSQHSSAIEVDLTEDEIGSLNSSFRKVEVKENLLSKYYKPPSLIPNRSQSMSRNVTSEEEDEEIQIIEELEFPKLKPRKPIVPISDLFQPDFMEKYKKKITSKTEHLYQTLTQNERKCDRFKKRREAAKAEEDRQREEKRAAGYIFPEDVEMEEEALPEITPEMDAEIEMAFSRRIPYDAVLSSLVTSRETITIQPSDIATLSGISWLNDQVINFYLGLIENRSSQEGFPTVHCFNSFFYTKLKKEGPSRILLRWTRKVDIFAKDLVMVPLHLEMHWALLVIDNRSKTLKYYDSMGSTEVCSLGNVENYLKHEMQDKKKTVLAPNTYTLETAVEIPKQMNGSDCGMFSLKYAEYISRDAPLTFNQDHMPYFRRRMVYEILKKEILCN